MMSKKAVNSTIKNLNLGESIKRKILLKQQAIRILSQECKTKIEALEKEVDQLEKEIAALEGPGNG